MNTPSKRLRNTALAVLATVLPAPAAQAATIDCTTVPYIVDATTGNRTMNSTDGAFPLSSLRR